RSRCLLGSELVRWTRLHRARLFEAVGPRPLHPGRDSPRCTRAVSRARVLGAEPHPLLHPAVSDPNTLPKLGSLSFSIRKGASTMFGIDSPLRSPIRSRIARGLGKASSISEEAPALKNVQNRKDLRSDPETHIEERPSASSVNRRRRLDQFVQGWLQ